MALVLALEPDLRQAALLKRVITERVQAEVVVVDSRDAAVEALGARVPDVILLTALLSPRDEDELIAHLRTLPGADHVQTHTIPQLASAQAVAEPAQPGGLLKRFRKKKAAPPLAGFDPVAFADEVREFVARAEELKGHTAPGLVSRATAPPPLVGIERSDDVVADTAAAGSAWSSPFEWKRADPAAPVDVPAARPAAETPRRSLISSMPIAVMAEAAEQRHEQEARSAAATSALDAALNVGAAIRSTDAAGHDSDATADQEHDRRWREADSTEREQQRIAAEAEWLRLVEREAAEREALRLQAEAAEKERRSAAETALRLQREADEERERVRVAAAAAERERLRLESEAAERERERARVEAEAAERERVRAAAELAEKERLRLAAEAAERERLRLVAEAAERERVRLELEAAVERERLRVAAELAEKERLRAAAEVAERERVRLAAEAAERERVRLAAEAAKKEQARLAAEAAEERERLRLAAEAAKKERARVEAEAAAERKRLQLAADAARKETARLAAEAAAAERERVRLAAEAARKEQSRLEAEAAAERKRLQLAAEAARKEQARLAAEGAAERERFRVAAQASTNGQARLEAEAARREQIRLEDEAATDRETRRLTSEAAARERRQHSNAVDPMADDEREDLSGPAGHRDHDGDAFADFRIGADARRAPLLSLPLAFWTSSKAPAKPAQSAAGGDPLRDLIAGLSLALVAGVRYGSGCRIRRVRVPAADPPRMRGARPLIVSRRLLDETRARETSAE
ncbi:MAG: hypothetical protein ABI818_19260 [Acidobacteriota bacterium]